jgi:uncharacterized membrane protein
LLSTLLFFTQIGEFSATATEELSVFLPIISAAGMVGTVVGSAFFAVMHGRGSNKRIVAGFRAIGIIDASRLYLTIAIHAASIFRMGGGCLFHKLLSLFKKRK